MLAAQIETTKFEVTLYEKKKTVGRKFLVAGEGGLNLTYNASFQDLNDCYFPNECMASALRNFNSEDLRAWFDQIGVSTFVGSSNRVFPEEVYKPVTVLNRMVEFIKSRNVNIRTNCKWIGWSGDGSLLLEGGDPVEAHLTVFSLGGASWKVTGSDGEWSTPFKERGITVVPFRAANCAFSVTWNKDFIKAHKGKPLKNIALSHRGHTAKGELVVTEFGLEGNAIYALSQKIQETLLQREEAVIHLDLKPTMTVGQIKNKYKSARSADVTGTLKKELNLNRTEIGVLKQFSDRDTFLQIDALAKTIKSVPVTVRSADKLDKAISTLGGIALNEVDENFQLKQMPNAYAIGEMLDWYAPTGGYLLQGCFSMGYALAKHLNELEASPDAQ